MLLEKLQALRSRANKLRFARTSARVRQTAPLIYTPSPDVWVVSMVGHDSVDMYLVAVKSFMVFFVDASIEVINDGSLTAQDQALLREQIPGVYISNSADVDTGRCPSYSSWKRLFRIIERSQTSYVVQLDSDTVAAGPMVEIERLASTNTGFMIGDGHWTTPVSPRHMQSIAGRWHATGPQAFLERVLADLDIFPPGQRYLHGCAGFAGYPRGSLSRDAVEKMSLRIEEGIGRDNWHKWGSEQAISNCLISLTPNACTLPWPKYRNYMFPATNDPFTAACFIHFVGTHRYRDTVYSQAVEQFYSYYNSLISPKPRARAD
jgi:hypothetical protein